MQAGAAFLQELEQAVSHGSSARRVEMLRQVTDLFVTTAESCSAEQLELFDDVIGRLARDIEVGARVELARRMALAQQAPALLARALAFDDDIEVAEPVLSQGAYLDDSILLEGARSKSQNHLLAISRRKSLSEPVTDILVTRGNRKVVHTVAGNQGARFSENGFETLVQRSENDDDLAETVGLRRDIPPRLFNALIVKASDMVRKKLMEAHPDAGSEVRQVVTDVAVRVEAQAHLTTRDYSKAERQMEMLHQAGLLDQAEIDTCARAGSVEEVLVGLSLICGIPINVVEHAFLNDRLELFMIILKACGMKWPTVKTILALHSDRKTKLDAELKQAFAMYEELQIATAQRVLRFYRARTTFN